jgi:putative protease
LTVDSLRDLGAVRITAAYDLHPQQLLDLAAAVPPRWLEVVLYQHMPLFHSEHCLFRATAPLSPCGRGVGGEGNCGTPRGCGRPCRRHDLRLRDRRGAEHPLMVDAACRNTLFHAEARLDFEAVPGLLRRGVRDFRIEFLGFEGPEEVGQVLDRCRRAVAIGTEP